MPVEYMATKRCYISHGNSPQNASEKPTIMTVIYNTNLTCPYHNYIMYYYYMYIMTNNDVGMCN